MTDDLGDLLLTVARTLRRGAASRIGEYDVTPAQARALRILVEHGPVRLSVLAEHLRIAPRSATEVVDALESAGLAARQPDPTDRRAVVVAPTRRGVEVQSEVDVVRRQQHRAFLATLSTDDRRELERILRLLV